MISDNGYAMLTHRRGFGGFYSYVSLVEPWPIDVVALIMTKVFLDVSGGGQREYGGDIT